MFLVDDLRAQYTATAITKVPSSRLGLVYLIDGGTFGAGGGGGIYRMRGFDGDLGYPVYWESVIVDTLGVDYSGNSGALSDVVVSEVIAG
jgi:hypothetical protein